jgi:hypothetical protein
VRDFRDSQSPGLSFFFSGKSYIFGNYYIELRPPAFPIDRSTPVFTLRWESLVFGSRRAFINSRIAGRWPIRGFGGGESMRRWIAWTAALLAGAFCICPGFRTPWFGHGNEPRDEGALYVCVNVLSQQHISREVRLTGHKAPPFDLQVQSSCKPCLQFFAEETTKTAFARVAQDR